MAGRMPSKFGEAVAVPPELPDGADAAGAERRREPRIPGRLEVRFSLPSQAGRALRAYSLNYSLGGLCLKPQRPYPVGSQVALSLQIQSESLELEAVVAWARDGAIGVRFVNLAPAARERLSQLIEHVSG